MRTESPTSPVPFKFPPLDRWVRRVATGALVALAMGLVGLGIALYTPDASARPGAHSPASASSPRP